MIDKERNLTPLDLTYLRDMSGNSIEFMIEMIDMFKQQTPLYMDDLEQALFERNWAKVSSFAHKIKPTLDLLGLNVAFEEILQVEAWTKSEGKKKEIVETFKSIKVQVKEAIKEIKKDFDV